MRERERAIDHLKMKARTCALWAPSEARPISKDTEGGLKCLTHALALCDLSNAEHVSVTVKRVQKETYIGQRISGRSGLEIDGMRVCGTLFFVACARNSARGEKERERGDSQAIYRRSDTYTKDKSRSFYIPNSAISLLLL